MPEEVIVCEKCGSPVKVVNDQLVPAEEKFNAKKKGIPFHCRACGSLKFPIKAIRDVVFLWPDPLPETVKANSKLIIPEAYRKQYKNDFGYVLSAGPGYAKKGCAFRPSELKAGDRVMYDKSTPWKMPVEDQDGVEHQVRMMGALDVKAKLEE